MASDILANGWAKVLGGDRKQFGMFLDRMLDGFAYHKIVVDRAGKPVDYVFLEVNHPFEMMTGLKRERIIGKRVTEVLPSIKKDPADLIGVYGRVALTAEPVQFENQVEPLGKWYKVSAYCPVKGYFVALLEDITERKQLECEIENMAKFPSENPNPVFRIDGKGMFTYCNQVGVSFLATWNSKVGEHAPEHISQVAADALASDKRVEVEEAFGAKTFSLLFVPVILEGYVNVYGNDITERKKAEEALKESEHLYRTVLENSQDGFQLIELMYDENGKPYDYKFLRVNRAYEKIIGVKAKDVTGKTARYISPNCESYWVEVPDRVVKTGRSEHVELYNKDINKTLDCYYLPYSKNIVGTLFRDVTERKKLEETVEKRTISLNASEEKYRTLFDSIDEGFCIIEMVFDAEDKPSDYRFLEINASFERQTGLHNAKGQRIRSLVPNYEAYWFEIYGKVALTGQSIRFTNEAKALNRWYDVFAFPVGEGKIQNVAVLFNDITQRRNLEKQLQDSERLAAIGATAGMVGHDIRNPLQSIIGEIFLSKKEIDDLPENDAKRCLKDSIQSIEDNAFYMNKIVSDLQDYAKPLKPSIEETDFTKVAEDVFSTLKVPENINVFYCIEPCFTKLMTDPSAMKRILTNLSSNAVQAMPKGGKLTLEAACKDGKVFISVHDTGLGIPDETKDKLFKPLFTTKAKGQGFGLAVVKKLTEALNGKVSVESEVGKGTRFTVEFPIQKKAAPLSPIHLKNTEVHQRA